ncbi:MAG TPA: glutamate formimidoyltransferase [Bacteroidales bacterium]|nr:glutamate formimidoyltransferase [Bacteroidales bacterium]
MNQLIECVPNFSEGNDMGIIRQITGQIESVEGVRLLDVDPGKATNRTVVTFVGEPDGVLEAAFLAVKRASEVIDMRFHKGEHPRFGATDVCPLVPIRGITMEEVAELARKLARRIGDELGIPVYCYENAAFTEERRNLANCRAGEYEGLPEKLRDPKWKPDFGPDAFAERVALSGATAVGARDFLVAYNINLNTTSVRRANAVAYDIREKGRPVRDGHPITGTIKKDENGQDIYVPGALKACKAIGWFIEEYGIAQVSVNLTNIRITPVHVAFEEACRSAEKRGMRVTGSERVGLIPLQALLDAGKYFLGKQQRSAGISEKELIKIAVKSLGLDDLKPFRPEEKIIEYQLKDATEQKLIDRSVQAFTEETASESPAPGGGSVSATVGALGAALGTMVANLSSHKAGWDERWEEFSGWAEKGQRLVTRLLFLVDEDTRAFNKIMEAYGLPKKTKDEAAARKRSIEDASRYAIQIPFQVMETALASMEILKAMAESGLPASISDVGVGALCARTAVMGAFLNVKINAAGLDDRTWAEKMIGNGILIEQKALESERAILEIVAKKISPHS